MIRVYLNIQVSQDVTTIPSHSIHILLKITPTDANPLSNLPWHGKFLEEKKSTKWQIFVKFDWPEIFYRDLCFSECTVLEI